MSQLAKSQDSQLAELSKLRSNASATMALDLKSKCCSIIECPGFRSKRSSFFYNFDETLRSATRSNAHLFARKRKNRDALRLQLQRDLVLSRSNGGQGKLLQLQFTRKNHLRNFVCSGVPVLHMNKNNMAASAEGGHTLENPCRSTQIADSGLEGHVLRGKLKGRHSAAAAAAAPLTSSME